MFISFEGVDYSGKTTNIEYVKKELEKRGVEVEVFQDPDIEICGGEFKKFIMNEKTNELCDLSTALLFTAQRVEISNKIRFALSEKKLVLCDRYIHSTFAHQDLNVEQRNIFRKLHKDLNILVPDLTFLMSTTEDEIKKRIDKNKKEDDNYRDSSNRVSIERFEDVFDQDKRIHFDFMSDGISTCVLDLIAIAHNKNISEMYLFEEKRRKMFEEEEE